METQKSKDDDRSLAEDETNYSESQKLLILQQRQIVRHLISLKDWIILCIFTPKQASSKLSQTESQQSIPQIQLRDITQFVSVLAIRTEQKQQMNENKKLQKQCIGEIKMIHKQSRVQNLIQWKCQDRGIYDQQSQYQQTKHFLILSYTKIQLYKISSNPSNINLIKIFSTPFLIPFNIIQLKNNKKEQQQKKNIQKKKNTVQQKQHIQKMRKLFSDQTKQKKEQYAIGMVGIDRSQSFWSGYYEIESTKRHLYLFKQNDISNIDALKISPKQQNFPSQSQGESRKLRRVKSAQNIFEVENKRNNDLKKRQQLSSTQVYTRRESTGVMQDERKSYNRSPSTKCQEEQLSFIKQSTTTINKLKSLKQPSLQRFIPQNNPKPSPKLSASSRTPLPTELLYNHKIQLYPSLISQPSKTSSPFKKNRPTSHKHNQHLFASYNNGSTKCNPPVEHVCHFYSERLVEVEDKVGKRKIERGNDQNDVKNNNSNRKRYRKQNELMVVVAYFNNVVLINVPKQQTISKVVLDQSSYISKTLPINNIFGIFSSIILLKPHKPPTHNSTKLIKLTVDTINHQQLGIGLEPVKILSFGEEDNNKSMMKEHIVDCFSVVGDVDALEREIMRGREYVKWLEEKRCDEGRMKMSFDQVRELIVQEEQEKTIDKNNIREDQKPLSPNDFQLTSWLSHPFSDLQHSIILITNSGRILLQNHLTSITRELLSPSSIIHSVNKLFINPLSPLLQPSSLSQQYQQPILQLKMAMIYSTDINLMMMGKQFNCNSSEKDYQLHDCQNNQNYNNKNIGRNLIQQLKQITF